jgi:hypothetical protein
MSQKTRIEFTCEFCHKKFANKQNVLRHQKTACKKKSPDEEFKCKYCEKAVSRKNILDSHIETCSLKKEYKLKKKNRELENYYKNKSDKWKKECKQFETDIENLKWELKSKNRKFKKIIEEKDKEIISLKIKCESNKTDVYHEVCDKVLDKSTVTNNTAYIHPKLANLPVTNIHPLTEDYVKKQVANGEYSFDHYRKGEDGIVDFINSITMCENDNGEIERSYVSTDASRDSFHRLVETKEWEKDKGGKFIDVILDTLGNRANNYQLKLMDERREFKDSRCPHGYDPETLLKRNTDMHSGIVETNGKERLSLRKRIKKETSNKVAV